MPHGGPHLQQPQIPGGPQPDPGGPNLPQQPDSPLLPFLKQVDQTSGGFKKEKTFLNSGNLTTLDSSGTPKSNHISFTVADRTDLTSREYGNLFSSFNYPITDDQKTKFTGTTFINGGFSDTAFSAIGNQDKIVIIDIPKNHYGELIDGKTVKLTIPSGETTIDLYSTFFNDPIAILSPDTLLSDPQPHSHEFGQPNQDNPTNVAYLFTDAFSGDTSRRPNADTSKSWSTGHGNKRPFDKGGKELANFMDDNAASLKKDEPVGIAYLSSGFLVIHDSILVNELEARYGVNHTKTGSTSSEEPVLSSASTQFKSFVSEFVQHVVCIADLDEFNVSTNKTFEDVYGVGGVSNNSNEPVYITEIGLYNSKSELIGIAKTSEPIPKSKNSIIALDIKITV